MHLKSLTLRGFKSFASSTTLHFEPGITCVVGPNGSGKSNVVDAIAWVMGEQGAKSLRGGKMEDVIFAGTSGRPPLGRAEVLLTIDNPDGVLPIEYSEVTISRTMFRNGGSEYAINGTPCRLLDVQELLSDSGIGREMHVIVGQGKLDEILSASPEDRRGFIEEAAGVLKHRKRKEKALRKLDAMQANLTRLQDLTTELRRQLKPLGKQAEVARRAAVIQADLRDSRLRLIADDLVTLRDAVEQEVADETALRERRAEVESELAGAQAREAVLEAEIAGEAPTLARDPGDLVPPVEPARAGPQHRGARRRAGAPPAARARGRAPRPRPRGARGRGPRGPRGGGRARSPGRRPTARCSPPPSPAAPTAEAAHAAEEQRLTALRARRRRPPRGAGPAHRPGPRRDVAPRGPRGRGRAARTPSTPRRRARADKANAGLPRARVAGRRARRGRGRPRRGARGRRRRRSPPPRPACRRCASRSRRPSASATPSPPASRRSSSGLARKDGGAARARRRRAALRRARHRRRAACTSSPATRPRSPRRWARWPTPSPSARSSARRRRRHACSSPTTPAAPSLLVGGAPAPDRVVLAGAAGRRALGRRPRRARPTTSRGSVAVALAARGRRRRPRRGPRARRATHDVVAVTRDGRRRSPPASRTAARPARRRCSRCRPRSTRRAPRSTDGDAPLRAGRASSSAAPPRPPSRAQQRVDAALSRLHESDARMAAVAEQLGQLGSAARAASRRGRAASRPASPRPPRPATPTRPRSTSSRPGSRRRRRRPTRASPRTDERDRLAEAAVLARQAEVEARLAVRTGEERVARPGRPRRAARARRRRRARRPGPRRSSAARRGARAAAVAAAVHAGAGATLARLEVSLADRRRTSATPPSRRARCARASCSRCAARTRELQTELESLTSSVHRDEMARAEQRLRIEQLEAKAMEEFGVDAETLVDEYGPDVLVPPSPIAPGDEVDPEAPEPEPYPYVRAEQEKRHALGRALARPARQGQPARARGVLRARGAAPLPQRAARRPQALARRPARRSSRDVDERVQQVFAEAYADVEREFERIFARLFPGGEGRLLLTDPDDLLTTGIEVEARPPGKKVKRLSLLSGGERSLTAVAFLVALFKARPSPFYIMDEVEAALDDVNLQRLLDDHGGAARGLPAARHHPPEAHDGDRRRALRRLDARRRRHHGDRPAPAATTGDEPGDARHRHARRPQRAVAPSPPSPPDPPLNGLWDRSAPCTGLASARRDRRSRSPGRSAVGDRARRRWEDARVDSVVLYVLIALAVLVLGGGRAAAAPLRGRAVEAPRARRRSPRRHRRRRADGVRRSCEQRRGARRRGSGSRRPEPSAGPPGPAARPARPVATPRSARACSRC